MRAIGSDAAADFARRQELDGSADGVAYRATQQAPSMWERDAGREDNSGELLGMTCPDMYRLKHRRIIVTTTSL